MAGLSWKDRHGEAATCVRCLEVKDTAELDRLFWCQRCQERARRRAARWGWGVGALVAAGLAAWVYLVVQPVLLPGGWIGILAAALYLAHRIVREGVYGAMRLRNCRAVDAQPPAGPEGRGS